jgi:hypothetical protein
MRQYEAALRTLDPADFAFVALPDPVRTEVPA